jgi:molybdate transport system ATP-binding protein
MSENKHWAIFLSNNTDKKIFIKNILDKKSEGKLSSFNDLNGMLFSDILSNEIIEEEAIRDHFVITNRSFRTLSGGEKKKALLQYCLAKDPDFIILDNPFDNLDTASQDELKNVLSELSARMVFIQLINRKEDVLPFIKNAISLENDNSIKFYDNVESYLKIKTDDNFFFHGHIPQSLKTFEQENDILISFNNVSVTYDEKPILKNISWQIRSGEFWQLMGPNGSGKTTMLSMITGDNVKGYGQDLTLFGKRKGTGESVWEIKEKIGYFTSSMIELFARNNTLEQMILSGFFDSVGLYTIPSELQIRTANEWLVLIKMHHLKNKIFNRLTLGQQRIALIVRAMIKNPPLLILDEPTAGLDNANIKLVNSLINKIATESKITILYVSHRIEEGLEPRAIYELIPNENGSTGKVLK